jgi:hypothetical protein
MFISSYGQLLEVEGEQKMHTAHFVRSKVPVDLSMGRYYI